MKLTRQMLFPLAFYEKSPFHGSKGIYNYRIEKRGSEEEARLVLTVWEGPECYRASKTEKTEYEYPFTEAGMEEITEFLLQL